jgi:hypothetical protein
MARIPLELKTEIKELLLERLGQVRTPFNIKLNHILRTAIYTLLMMDDQTLEEFLSMGYEVEENYNEYLKLFEGAKNNKLIPEDLPATNSFYTEIFALLVLHEKGKLSDKKLRSKMEIIEATIETAKYTRKTHPTLLNSYMLSNPTQEIYDNFLGNSYRNFFGVETMKELYENEEINEKRFFKGDEEE